jgi:hypothetical protein
MTSRADAAQGEPDRVTASFPARQETRVRWFREHESRSDSAGAGCWFLASTAPDANPVDCGRFDLAQPDGTCSLAAASGVEARERLRAPEGGMISSAFAANRVVSTMRLAPNTCANLKDKKAAYYGVMAELTATSDYALTQWWAAKFHSAGFAGIRCRPRFSTGTEVAVAVFGQHGPAAKREILKHESLRDVLDRINASVIEVLRSTDNGFEIDD